MNFANQNYLPFIYAASAAIVIFYIAVLLRRRSLMERFSAKDLIRSIAPGASTPRRVFRISMVAVAFILCMLALARPQWGFIWEETKKTGVDILIAIDVSKSMLATDVKPDRLERSKFAVKDLIKKLNGDRIGLVAFAGTAFLQCPLTIDYNGFLLSLDDLTTASIPRPGTSITSAIREAMDVFKGPEKKYKVMVIITDGEDFEGDALKAAKQAAEMGIRIYCVGVGTQEGELIPAVGADGERGYLGDRSGQAVKTRLNEDILQKIALSTGGSYVKATQAEFGLVLLYDKSISKLEKKDIDAKMRRHYQDRFQYFLALALILLFLEPLVPDRKAVAI
jgi:Ca-activated chloride channel family protein